jgi:hypothetical protein
MLNISDPQYNDTMTFKEQLRDLKQDHYKSANRLVAILAFITTSYGLTVYSKEEL